MLSLYQSSIKAIKIFDNGFNKLPQIVGKNIKKCCGGQLNVNDVIDSIKYNHLDCFVFFNNKCQPTLDIICTVCQFGTLTMLRHIISKECVRTWIVEHIILAELIQYDRVECVVYVFENKFHYTNLGIFTTAVQFGSINCLEYFHKNNATYLDQSVAARAAFYGKLDCLKYVHKHGFSWNVETCAQASKGDQLVCLKYAHENGCDWDYSTIYFALLYGHLECLKYALENNCNDYGIDMCNIMINRHNISSLRYFNRNKYWFIPIKILKLEYNILKYKCPWTKKHIFTSVLFGIGVGTIVSCLLVILDKY